MFKVVFKMLFFGHMISLDCICFFDWMPDKTLDVYPSTTMHWFMHHSGKLPIG